MNRDTYEKLRKMRLPEMASQYRKHAESPELYATMTFDEEFGLLVCVHRSSRSPRPAELSGRSAEIEQWHRPD